jgi:transposase
LAQVCADVSDSLENAYLNLMDLVSKQPVVNVDETGHKNNGDRLWTWCFRAPLFTLFKISPSRGSDVLVEVLGKEFNGLLGCDYFSAYRKYMKDFGVLVQFCLAHLIRDIKFLTTHPDKRNQKYGNRVLDAVRAMFAIIHRRDEMSAEQFAAEMEDAGNTLWGEAIHQVPDTKDARNLANRFEKHGESYIRFITTPGIEPTNNLAEQAIRFVVIDRYITQGTRSETGQHWSERIWTVIATCTQQARSVFTFIYDSVTAYFHGEPAPQLMPNTS